MRFGGISVEIGRAMVLTHGETKRAWYAPEAYQKGTIRYLPYPNSALLRKNLLDVIPSGKETNN